MIDVLKECSGSWVAGEQQRRKRMNRTLLKGEWQRIFVNQIPDKGLLSKTYEEPL